MSRSMKYCSKCGRATIHEGDMCLRCKSLKPIIIKYVEVEPMKPVKRFEFPSEV